MDFESVFQKLARFDNRHRFCVMVFMLATTALLALGLLNIRLETDPQSLWVSHDSQGYKEEMYFNDNFGAFFRTEQIMMVQTDDGSRNLLDTNNKNYLYAMYFIETMINRKNTQSEGKNTTIADLCYRPINAKGCYHPSPLDMWQMNITDVANDTDVQFTNLCIRSRDPKSRIPCSDINGIPVLKESIFGGMGCAGSHTTNETIPCTPCWIEAKALMLTYLLNNDEYTYQNALDWEKDVLEDTLLKYNANNGSWVEECRKYFNVSEDGTVDIGSPTWSFKVNLNDLTGKALGVKLQYMSERSIPDELSNETSQNLWIVVISYSLMFLYVGIAIGRFPSFRDSGFALALLGIFIVICSVICSMGIIAYLNIGFTMISGEVIPFLILAIGVDNMFIIKNAVENQKKLGRTVPLEHRLAEGLKEVGPSITTAAICQTLAFLVGALTKMPALQSFCLQAALAVLFDFIFQITAFVVFMAWDEERREASRIDLVCCFRATPPEQELEPKDGFWKRVFAKKYAPLIANRICLGVVMVIFAGMLTASVFGLFKIPVGLNEQVSMETQSDLFNYFTYEKKYIEVGPPAYIVLENFDYLNPDHTNIIDDMSNGLSRLDMVQPPVYSWIGVFNHFRDPKSAWNVACGTQDIDRYPIQQQLKRFMAVEIGSVCCQTYGICGEQFNKDISFNDDGTIRSSRLRFMHTPLRNSSDYIRAAESARQTISKITKNFTQYYPDAKAFPYSLFYIYYDQYSYIRSIAVENLLLALAVVFLAVVLIQNLKLALIITLMVLLTTFNLIGMVYIDNLLFKDHGFIIEINAISVVNLITCVGLAVEFTAHVAIAFSKETGPKMKRLENTLRETGSSVFIGIGLTKFVGVVVLAFAKSTLFRLYYFRMYLGIVLMGVFHGLVFLPSVLYWTARNITFDKAKLLDEERNEQAEPDGKSE